MRRGGHVFAARRRGAPRPAPSGGAGGPQARPAPSEHEPGELSTRLAAIEAELRAVRDVLAAASTLDLEEVLAAVLRAVRSRGAYEALAVAVEGSAEEEPLVAGVGLELDEAKRACAWLDAPGATGVVVRFEYGGDPPRTAVRGAVSVRVGLGRSTAVMTSLWTVERSPDDDEVTRLRTVGERFAPALRCALEHRRVLREADRDPLTGLYNQRYLRDALAREAARAARRGEPLTFLMLDLDAFKSVNERLGHLAADAVLAEVAEAIRSTVRASEVACRAGGDEFAVILPATPLGDAVRLHERIRETVRTAVPSLSLGVSGGAAQMLPNEPAARLFERADKALFRAKAEGRGSLTLAEEAAPSGRADDGLHRTS